MFVSKGRCGYYYLFFTDELTDKRRSVTTGTKLKHDANKFLIDYKNRVKEHLRQKNFPTILISDFQDEVLKYADTNIRKTTREIYSRVFRNLISIFGNRAVRNITSREVEEYKATRLKTVSRTTVNIEFRTLKSAFNIGKQLNLIEENPCLGLKQLKSNEKEMLVFSDKEIELIFSNVKDIVMSNIILFGLNTGCRLNEILNVQVKDINFQERVILIRNKEDFETKTGKIRRIPLPDKLDIHKIISKAGGKYEGPENVFVIYDEEKYVFSKEDGTRYSMNYISHYFKKILRKSGLPEKFHFHCLRHTYGTKLANSGVAIHQVQELMGHSTIKTTEKYFHVTMEDLKKAVNKINYT